MKVIIQRVTKAHVSVDDSIVSSIGKGLCVLVGIHRDDTIKDAKIKKILNTRFFETENKKWNASVKDKQYEILCISQFTLCYQFKGNKLSFHNAMETEKSKQFYNDFLFELRKQYIDSKVQDGVFGAYMQVHIENDGPVSITLESATNEGKPEQEPDRID